MRDAMPNKKFNLRIMLITNFIVAASMTMIMPFISLYIDTMGNFSTAYVQKWAGLCFGATFISAFLMSPIWGRIADQYGYKPIMIINCFGMATSVFLMNYVQNVEQLFLLRLIMGTVAGFISTSNAFVSKNTPTHIAGKTLGTLQMGSVGGHLLGPVIGGFLADAVGFSYTFLLTAVTITIAAIIITFGIHESDMKKSKKQQVYSRKHIIIAIFHHRSLMNIMLVTALVQIGNFSIQPLLSLYVADLTDAQQVSLLAGITFSATGIGTFMFTRYWGLLADNVGYEKVLTVLLFISVVFIVPQAFVTSLWQLIVLRILFGISSGGLLPIMIAFIRRETPSEIQGEVMGYNQSCKFFGNIIGPVFGGIISSIASIPYVFYSTGMLFFVAAIIVFVVQKQPKQLLQDELKLQA